MAVLIVLLLRHDPDLPIDQLRAIDNRRLLEGPLGSVLICRNEPGSRGMTWDRRSAMMTVCVSGHGNRNQRT